MDPQLADQLKLDIGEQEIDVKPLFSVERGDKMVELLVDFPEKFTRNLDELWQDHDVDGEGQLNQSGTLQYLLELQKCVVDQDIAK